MREDFQEKVKLKTDKELEIISKDYAFYSTTERLIALNELECRRGLLQEQQNAEIGKMMDDKASKSSHRICLKDLLPQKSYTYTPLLLYANIFIFKLMVLATNSSIFNIEVNVLTQWGGNFRPLTINGQFWRLFTSMFLHINFYHLAVNMFALLYIGSILEKTIGRGMFLFAYIVSGIVASVSSLLINDMVVSVGASGAIFGVFGVLFVLLQQKDGFDFPAVSREQLLGITSMYAVISIINGFLRPGVDNAAHIGGLLCGILIGFAYSLVAHKKFQLRSVYITLTLLVLSFATLSISHVPNIVEDSRAEISRTLADFQTNHERALLVYQINLGNITSDNVDFYKKKVKAEGIEIWEKNITMLENLLRDHSFIEEAAKQVNMLIEFSILHKKLCELMLELLSEYPGRDKYRLMDINARIERKVNDIQTLQGVNNVPFF